MNSASTTNDDDLRKGVQQLQIDTDLANATGLTAASSYTTPVSNRTQNDVESDEEWDTFYGVDGVDRTPPKATQNMKFSIAEARANELLSTSGIEEFAGKSLGDLTKDQQAIIMLMVTSNMDQRGLSSNFLVDALKPETKGYKALMSFVRKGGDVLCLIPSLVVNRFKATRQQFVKDNPDAITIFHDRDEAAVEAAATPPAMMPFLHVQEGCSYICTFNACSVLLYYCSYDIESRSAIQKNISRYIRDEIDGLKIANMTLTKQKGANLEEVLTGLMMSFGTAEEDRPAKIPMFSEDVTYIYTQLWLFLKNGRPIALGIEWFPALDVLKETEFTREVVKKYGGRRKPEHRHYHAVVCIGIKPGKGEMPPMLLLQDSSHMRPAYSIGLDLLVDMGLKNLPFFTLPAGWKPNTDMTYEVTEKTRVYFAGSPMAIDKNDEPYIVPSKKPVREKRDMTPYLHPSGPGTPQVYIV